LTHCIDARAADALRFTPDPLTAKEHTMGLKGTKTEQNLKDAFAGESQANRRYLYFANKADIEGQNDVAALFRSTAEGETGRSATAART
jgi:glycine cleavage system aminomethyltransferase T